MDDVFQKAEEDWKSITALFTPKERMSVGDFSAKHRWLFNEGGGFVGRWSHAEAPYLEEPMNCLTSLDLTTVVVAGPGQSGKTSVAENWLCYGVKNDPGDMLWFMQSDDSLEAYVKSRINRMIEGHDYLSESLGKDAVDDSLHYKKFRTMTVEFLTATAKNLISKSVPRIIADEIDNYAAGIGDVKHLLDIRRQTFGMESMLLITSHPDLARGMNPDQWNSGVMGVYADSDRRVWYWECPQCKCWSSPCPLADDKYMHVAYPEEGTLDEIEEGAVLVCPHNGCAITDHQRLKMIKFGKGRWIAKGQSIAKDGTVTGHRVGKGTAGFWIVGPMSPFVFGGIGGLAKARAKAEREFEYSQDDKTLKEVMVKQWGFPYQPPKLVGTVTANELAERSEEPLKLKTVPVGVRFLTAAFDNQLGHMQCLVRGWGERGESWIVDSYRVDGDPATNPDDWDKMIKKMLLAAYPLEGNEKMCMPIRGVGYDSAGLAGVTVQAYDAFRRWKRLKHVRSYGEIANREIWSVVCMKGANSPLAPKINLTYPDTSENKDRAASQGDVPMLIFNPNQFKDDLAAQLRKVEGPWSVHFPRSLRSKEPPHVWFEQVVAEERNHKGGWEKINKGKPNENLDLMVMTNVLAQYHGVARINWQKPPPWAETWDKNTFLIPAEKVDFSAAAANNTSPDKKLPGVKIIVEGEKNSSSLPSRLA